MREASNKLKLKNVSCYFTKLLWCNRVDYSIYVNFMKRKRYAVY